MVEEYVISRTSGLLAELRPEHLILITTSGFMSPAQSSNEDGILVLDLGILNVQDVLTWLNTNGRDLKSGVIVLGTAEQLQQAQEPLTEFDITFVEKPEGLPEEQILQFLYDQLGSVYGSFRRVGAQFAPVSAAAETQPSTRTSGQQQLLAAIFGEHADTVEPLVSEIDPAYSQPPFSFTPAQHDQLLALLRKPETEKRTDSD